MNDAPAFDTASLHSCGLVAQANDSIDRLGFIALRYRAWIGEALAHPFALLGARPDGKMLLTLHGTFDVIEHLAADFLYGSADEPQRTLELAGKLMDSAAEMRRILIQHREAVGDRLVPSIADLEQLWLVCKSRGGRPQWFETFDRQACQAVTP